MTEAEAIALFMTGRQSADPLVVVDVGDDAAVLEMPSGYQWVTSMDTAIAGCHFPENFSPYFIGYRTCAMAVSDLYAMGVKPCFITVSLSVMQLDHAWMSAFRDGFWAACFQHGVDVIGGDLTRGPTTVTVHAMGLTPRGQYLCQKQARLGDDVWVTSCVGGAYQVLQQILNDEHVRALSEVFEPPQSTVDLLSPYACPKLGTIAPALHGLVHSAVDVSDGLAKDVLDLVPKKLGVALFDYHMPWAKGLEVEHRIRALETSDDYGVLSTASPKMRDAMSALGEKYQMKMHRIGKVMLEEGCFLHKADGTSIQLGVGYEHFGT